jgi:hypothetical protein
MIIRKKVILHNNFVMVILLRKMLPLYLFFYTLMWQHLHHTHARARTHSIYIYIYFKKGGKGFNRKKEEKGREKKKRGSPALGTTGEESARLVRRSARGEKVTGTVGTARSTGENDRERRVGFPACVRVSGMQGFSAGESVENGEENKREGGGDSRDGLGRLGWPERFAQVGFTWAATGTLEFLVGSRWSAGVCGFRPLLPPPAPPHLLGRRSPLATFFFLFLVWFFFSSGDVPLFLKK